MLVFSIKEAVITLLGLTGLAIARPAPEPDLLIPEHRGYWPLRRKDHPADVDVDAEADSYVTALHSVVGDSFTDSAPKPGRHRKPGAHRKSASLAEPVPAPGPEPAGRMWYEDLPSSGKTLVVKCAPGEPPWAPAEPPWLAEPAGPFVPVSPPDPPLPADGTPEKETLSQQLLQGEAEVAERDDQRPGQASEPTTADPTLVRMTRQAIDAHIRPYLDQLPTYKD